MSMRVASFWADRNRMFGVIMASGLGGIALLRFVLSGAITWWLIGPAAFLVAGLLAPAWLIPIRAWWMKLAAGLGYVNSRILLTVLFVVLIVPMALVLRLLGRQPIRLASETGRRLLLAAAEDGGRAFRKTDGTAVLTSVTRDGERGQVSFRFSPRYAGRVVERWEPARNNSRMGGAEAWDRFSKNSGRSCGSEKSSGSCRSFWCCWSSGLCSCSRKGRRWRHSSTRCSNPRVYPTC